MLCLHRVQVLFHCVCRRLKGQFAEKWIPRGSYDGWVLQFKAKWLREKTKNPAVSVFGQDIHSCFLIRTHVDQQWSLTGCSCSWCEHCTWCGGGIGYFVKTNKQTKKRICVTYSRQIELPCLPFTCFSSVFYDCFVFVCSVYKCRSSDWSLNWAKCPPGAPLTLWWVTNGYNKYGWMCLV